jgi:hypothetical protein
MGFKTETESEKVIVCIMFSILIVLIIFISIFQVSADLVLTDHVWQDKHTAVTHTVEAFGNQLSPAMCSCHG